METKTNNAIKAIVNQILNALEEREFMTENAEGAMGLGQEIDNIIRRNLFPKEKERDDMLKEFERLFSDEPIETPKKKVFKRNNLQRNSLEEVVDEALETGEMM